MHASCFDGPLQTFGFYTCSAALAVKQFFTIRALRRMALRSSATTPRGQRVQTKQAECVVPGYTVYVNKTIRPASVVSPACEMRRPAIQGTEGSPASPSVKCRTPPRARVFHTSLALRTRREALVQTT